MAGQSLSRSPHHAYSRTERQRRNQLHRNCSCRGTAELAFIPSFTLVNLGARYLTELWGQNFIFRAELKNATNKRYWSSAEYTSVYPGQPRIMYLSITTDLR